jgi:hypothetical protein
VKAILLGSSAPAVADALAEELARFEDGRTHDELQWMDVQLHACRVLNATQSVVFVTSQQMFNNGSLVDYAKAEGHRVVVVPTALAAKLPGLVDVRGQPIRNLDVFYREWDEGFKFTFIDPAALAPSERAIFDRTQNIMALLSWGRLKVSSVLISETMRVDRSGYEFAGMWRPDDRSIVIKRAMLRDLCLYAGTLLHELTHAATGTGDRTLEFEDALTQLLGTVAGAALKH